MKKIIDQMCSYDEAGNPMKKEELDYCHRYVNAFKGPYYSNGKNVNSDLNQIDKNIDFLIFTGNVNVKDAINFNNLKSPMIVEVQEPNGGSKSVRSAKKTMNKLYKTMKKTFMKGGKSGLLDAIKEDARSHSKVQSDQTTNLVGSIRNKVPYLILSNVGTVKFVDSDCDCENLYINGWASFDANSAYANNTYFISSLSSLLKSEKVFPKQLTPIISQKSEQSIKITYHTGHWSVDSQNQDIQSIPYNQAESLGLIVELDKVENLAVEVVCEDKSLETYKPINVTAVTMEIDTIPPFRVGNAPKVTVKCTMTGCDKTKVPVTITQGQGIQMNPESDDVNVQSQPTYTPKDKGGLSAAAIAGIVIACVVVVGAIIGVVVFFVLRKKKNGGNSSNEGGKENE